MYIYPAKINVHHMYHVSVYLYMHIYVENSFRYLVSGLNDIFPSSLARGFDRIQYVYMYYNDPGVDRISNRIPKR